MRFPPKERNPFAINRSCYKSNTREVWRPLWWIKLLISASTWKNRSWVLNGHETSFLLKRRIYHLKNQAIICKSRPYDCCTAFLDQVVTLNSHPRLLVWHSELLSVCSLTCSFWFIHVWQVDLFLLQICLTYRKRKLTPIAANHNAKWTYTFFSTDLEYVFHLTFILYNCFIVLQGKGCGQGRI